MISPRGCRAGRSRRSIGSVGAWSARPRRRRDLDAPSKQRHTARRIYHRLLDEHGMADISYQVVRTYVADGKPKIRAEAGRGPVKVFFPQAHRPGAEAEVDFGEVAINLRGELVTCMLLSLRMSFSAPAADPTHRPRTRNGQRLLAHQPLRRPAGHRSPAPRGPHSGRGPRRRRRPAAHRRNVRSHRPARVALRQDHLAAEERVDTRHPRDRWLTTVTVASTLSRGDVSRPTSVTHVGSDVIERIASLAIR